MRILLMPTDARFMLLANIAPHSSFPLAPICTNTLLLHEAQAECTHIKTPETYQLALYSKACRKTCVKR